MLEVIDTSAVFMDFFEQILIGFSQIPINLPSMIFEVMILGGTFTLLANWLSYVAVKRNFARDLSSLLDDYFSYTADVFLALKDEQIGPYETARAELRHARDQLYDWEKMYWRSLDRKERDCFSTFSEYMEQVTDALCHNAGHLGEGEPQIERYRRRVFEGLENIDNQTPFSELNRRYNRLVNHLWGFTLWAIFPRALKNKRRNAKALDEQVSTRGDAQFPRAWFGPASCSYFDPRRTAQTVHATGN